MSKHPKFPTQNDLSSEVREKAVTLLNQQLADISDLFTQIKQAHWNVKGPSFIALHELFDEVAGEILELVDEIAERTVQLGGVALGTARQAAKYSRLPEYPLEILAGEDHVKALSSVLATYGKSARKAIDSATEFGDADTADLFTQVSRVIDKRLWMIEAHVQSKD
ncbi:MAG TPA: DNA starvation/stationary phase protection protein Dps [Tepidisphaeraceae bacterium]|jgi:starvation-inducible DNA-binding protein|nr:DNA starvation/stationary phase protection protein Dps [Tepidisphaeraceae bacterium]